MLYEVIFEYSSTCSSTKTYSDQANFVPFIVETGGRASINAAGLHVLSRILAEGTAGLTLRQGRAALRSISWALAVQRASCLHRLPRRYMRLIVLLKARGGGNSDYQDLGLEVDDADPTDS